MGLFKACKLLLSGIFLHCFQFRFGCRWVTLWNLSSGYTCVALGDTTNLGFLTSTMAKTNGPHFTELVEGHRVCKSRCYFVLLEKQHHDIVTHEAQFPDSLSDLAQALSLDVSPSTMRLERQHPTLTLREPFNLQTREKVVSLPWGAEVS